MGRRRLRAAMLADGVLAQGDSDLAELRLEAGVEAADFDRGEGAVIGLADNGRSMMRTVRSAPSVLAPARSRR
jgi:hypothetical protein